jgi:zinc protease
MTDRTNLTDMLQRTCCGLLLLLGLLPLHAAPLVISETTLANGLRVVVYENHYAPVVASEVWYHVGSYNECTGTTGLSHLLEHMMFNGSKNYPGGKYTELIEGQGGRENAFTSELVTVFWATLAADRYELELKLEADRMQDLLLDPKEFDRERQVVMEERRLGENSPFRALYEEFNATTYKVHPYRNPVVGWMDDVRQLTHDEILAYYRTWYTPRNAVLVVAGDVDPKRVFAQAGQYFGKIKSHPITRRTYVEPPQDGERRVIIRRDVKNPSLMIGYHVPGRDDPDYYVLDVIDGILLGGRSARLNRRLVQNAGHALNVRGGLDVTLDPGLFYFSTAPRTFVMSDSVERDIYAELESLKTVPVRDSELTRVKNRALADFIYAQNTDNGMARRIGEEITLFGSIEHLNEYADKIAGVTKDDVIRVAAKYFSADNRTVARLLPETR